MSGAPEDGDDGPSPAQARTSTGQTPYVVLSGGYGGARFLQGLVHHVRAGGGDPDELVSVIGNTADDIWLHGLKICPDLDTVMYTLGGGIDPDRGWGRTQETWQVQEELRAYGVAGTWFGLGDRDLATHLVRTQMLEAGYPLSEVTAALCARWRPGVRLLPMTDDRVETHVVVEDTHSPSGSRVIHFQEYWVKERAVLPVRSVVPVGADRATPAPGVLDAIAHAEVVILPPSNPIVSVGTILAVPGIREALRSTPAKVVGLSPIVAGEHVRGMAAQLLEATGQEVSAAGVAELYGARRHGGLLDGWLVDRRDAHLVDRIEDLGVRCRAVPLMMTGPEATAEMVAAALSLVRADSGSAAR